MAHISLFWRISVPPISATFLDRAKSLPVSQSGEHFADTKKSYLYSSREQPQPLLDSPSYPWRGPGIYFVTGDHRIKGQWFIHHDGTVVVALAPY
jgi:hypothetical protein